MNARWGKVVKRGLVAAARGYITHKLMIRECFDVPHAISFIKTVLRDTSFLMKESRSDRPLKEGKDARQHQFPIGVAYH